jgi:DNA mismatch endonuclease (patch repair protein)
MRERVAVMVDGCFWHSCPLHWSDPQNNADWWRQKLDANVARDLDSTLALKEAGWAVVRVWEHESVVQAADAIEALVKIRRASSAAKLPSA